jgi:hypothetical protein
MKNLKDVSYTCFFAWGWNRAVCGKGTTVTACILIPSKRTMALGISEDTAEYLPEYPSRPTLLIKEPLPRRKGVL